MFSKKYVFFPHPDYNQWIEDTAKINGQVAVRRGKDFCSCGKTNLQVISHINSISQEIISFWILDISSISLQDVAKSALVWFLQVWNTKRWDMCRYSGKFEYIIFVFHLSLQAYSQIVTSMKKKFQLNSNSGKDFCCSWSQSLVLIQLSFCGTHPPWSSIYFATFSSKKPWII